MISFFRNVLNSKIGAGIALAVLVLITLAFVGGDLTGMSDSGGISAGKAVATVGKDEVDENELALAAKSALSRVQAQDPTMTMKVLIAQGGLEQVLDELIDRTATAFFGKKIGVVAGDRLIDSEIARIPAFQGVDGKFDQATFRQLLAQQGLSEKSLREDIAQGLIAQQLMLPAQFGTTMSSFAAKRYAALLDENRAGTVVALPSELFAPTNAPSDAELQAFYKSHTNAFIRPERRVIRFAAFGESAVKDVAAPNDADVAKRYQADAALYAAQDNRKITQLIVPTEAAAKAIAGEVAKGKTLEAAAQEKGLSAAKLEFFSKAQLSSQFSPAVADAVFAAPVGKLAAPQKSALGWHLIRVEEEQKKPERPLAAVKDEIVSKLTEEKKRSAFTDLLAKLEDEFSNGASLVEVAKSLGATVQTTAPITANGQVYGKPGETAPAVLQTVLKTAFAMDQEKPQTAQVTKDEAAPAGQNGFIVYDVTDITPSAPAPFKEIANDVKAAWALDKGDVAAKAAALQVQTQVRGGKTLEQAIAAIGKTLPPVQQVSMSRATLTAALRSGRQVPPPVSLMFHMAKGTVKVQSAGRDRGWFVVALKDVVPGKVESAQLVEGTQRELGGQLGQAYTDALGKAIRKEVGVKRYDKAIAAVRDQLAGAGSAE
ncbi:MAG: peptidylprolyl isomerase [Novosphingobium lindaniclasticum]|jgi:peptidyl-prolyl cis-trans isomerase D|uniref:SurA N-terminal domain-containing protein n=1 Tax=Novosphingobium lindaniclasticum TaxID=1329895 RepID=UPI002409000E|nr:SurA N-terminal domain-containing protein [Novosphingobium lindaniclasticum]MDF2638544.1 peptidylprolyl isomerase [Novosphingobium lindaniclasticum]